MVMNKEMEPNTNHVVNSVNLTNNEDKNVNRDFNPSVLGREFVRQYYTMLNEGPQNLFRFYSDNSSLIRGNEPGENVTPAYGQVDINKKLMSLNFRDCHTKIRQVDSLETVNKSVVIQVIGELSNNGQPMRRFFQTFILAPRTPTHYYVRNDIFRYQDEVFVDDDEGYTEENLDDASYNVMDNTTIDATNNTTVLSSSLVVNNNTVSVNQQSKINSSNTNEKLNGQLNEQENKELTNDLDRSNKFSCMNPEISPINTPVNTVTNSDDLQNLNNSGSEQSIHTKSFNKQTSSTSDNQTASSKDLMADDEQKTTSTENDTTDQTSTSLLVQPQLAPTPQEKPVIQEPRTYATMVQKKFGNLSTGSSLVINSLDKKDGQLIKSNEESLVNTVLNNNKKEKDDHLSNDWHFESNSKSNETNNQDNHRNGGQHSDEQQVFVGNLPQNIDEEQLRSYFNQYGEIVDVRICQKQGKTPNYGFITFNETTVVKKILSKKPIYFDNHRINVEEKKSGRNFNSSTSSGSFNRNKDKDNKDHLNNRSNFNNNSSGSGSSNQFISAFSNLRNLREERNRGFNDKRNKSSSNANNTNNSSGNRNSNNFSRR